MVAAGLLLGGCGSSKKTVNVKPGGTVVTPGKPLPSKPGEEEYKHLRPNNSKIVASILEEARKWVGTPYKYAGEDDNGVDCSGLTMKVFEKAAEVKLPRSSAAQMEYTLRVKSEHLTPGDLIFFAPSPGSERVSHVGLYVGEGVMIHASSSRGVVFTSVSEPWWAKRYHSSGRVAAIAADKGESEKKERIGEISSPAKTEAIDEVKAEVNIEPKVEVEKIPVEKVPMEKVPVEKVPVEKPVVQKTVHKGAVTFRIMPADSAKADSVKTDSLKNAIVKNAFKKTR